MKAEIITIGDEILIGQIVDTNSAWMAWQLNLAGIEVYQVTSVHDDRDHIFEALSSAEARADLVLITGGLGPTKDDITKKTLCEFFGTDLKLHGPTLQQIHERFSRRGIEVNKLNKEQALVPSNCQVIPNMLGTAPGMWFERGSTLFVSMPGVPFEMQAMMSNEIIPRVVLKGKLDVIYHKTILTQGVPESLLAQKIETWEDGLPGFIKLAYLPGPMSVRLRLSAKGSDKEFLEAEVNRQVKKLLEIIPDSVYGYDDDTMSMAIGRLLIERGQTLSVAESCTGGYISHLITLTPGASKWFNGSVVAYSNQVKTSQLAVSPASLLNAGAVSEEVASEMATGIRLIHKSDYGLATTGIAGPDGGTENKPVGTVWIAVAGPTKFIAQKFVFGNDRERNILRSSQTALQLLRKLIIDEQL